MWQLAATATAVLTVCASLVALNTWEPLTTLLVLLSPTPPSPFLSLPSVFIWLRWVNVALVWLLGPVLLIAVRLLTRRRDSVWLLLPVVALVFWGSGTAVAYFRPQPEPEDLILYKPAIYLYPRVSSTVSVTLDLDGRLTTCTPQPDSSGTWTVQASPEGRLRSLSGPAIYPYIYWEGDAVLDVDMTEGFVVPRGDVSTFLERVLEGQGLSEAERADFIEYWQPRMARHPYVLVRFEGDAYERVARLAVSPQPDSVIRVFMVFRGLDEPRAVRPQHLPERPSRRGFVVVEWGGSELAAR